VRTATWVAGADQAGAGKVEAVRNPATEEPLAEVPSATPQQVDAAVEAARAALAGWRRTPAGERGELLHGTAARTGSRGGIRTARRVSLVDLSRAQPARSMEAA
jgi:acyl-CoA reductase-like NAD-dependent aldehyde dehydrogenase